MEKKDDNIDWFLYAMIFMICLCVMCATVIEVVDRIYK